MTLRNTGKVGFQFSIIHPLREEVQDAKDEAEGEREALEADKHLDKRPQEDSGQNCGRQDVRPGQVLVIPTMVSLSCGHFKYENPFII